MEVINAVYRVLAFKFLNSKSKPYVLVSTDNKSYLIHTHQLTEIHLQEKTAVVSLAFFDTVSEARKFYYLNYDGGSDEEFIQAEGSTLPIGKSKN
jgi:hypothetical protein